MENNNHITPKKLVSFTQFIIASRFTPRNKHNLKLVYFLLKSKYVNVSTAAKTLGVQRDIIYRILNNNPCFCSAHTKTSKGRGIENRITLSQTAQQQTDFIFMLAEELIPLEERRELEQKAAQNLQQYTNNELKKDKSFQLLYTAYGTPAYKHALSLIATQSGRGVSEVRSSFEASLKTSEKTGRAKQ